MIPSLIVEYYEYVEEVGGNKRFLQCLNYVSGARIIRVTSYDNLIKFNMNRNE